MLLVLRPEELDEANILCWSEALSLLQWRASLTPLVRYELTDTIILSVLCTGYKATTHLTLCLYVLLFGPFILFYIFMYVACFWK